MGICKSVVIATVVAIGDVAKNGFHCITFLYQDTGYFATEGICFISTLVKTKNKKLNLNFETMMKARKGIMNSTSTKESNPS